MFERFTDRARRVLQLANQEAQRLNHDSIDAEHILIGLAKEGSDVGANVLRNLGVEPARLLEAVRNRLVEVAEIGAGWGQKLPQTPRALAVIERTISLAQEWQDNHVGTQHLLAALVGAGGIVGNILNDSGVTVERVREQVLALRGAWEQAAQPADPLASAGIGCFTFSGTEPPKLSAEEIQAFMKAMENSSTVVMIPAGSDFDRATAAERLRCAALCRALAESFKAAGDMKAATVALQLAREIEGHDNGKAEDAP